MGQLQLQWMLQLHLPCSMLINFSFALL